MERDRQEEMDGDSLSKLRVVDLKELLKERGLPTAGKKQELIDRLVGAAAAEEAEEEEGSSPAVEEQEAEEEEEEEEEKTGVAEIPTPAEGGEGVERGEEEEKVDFEEQEEEEDLQKEGRGKRTRDQEPEESPALKMQKAKDEGTGRIVSLTTSSTRVTAPAESAPEVETSPVPGPATKVILLENLSRPYTSREIREYLSVDGEVLEVKVDDVMKSFCFARYASEEVAQQTANRINGKTWPRGGKVLQVKFVAEEDMEKNASVDSTDGRSGGSTLSAAAPAVEKPKREDSAPASSRHSSSSSSSRSERERKKEEPAKTLEELFKKTKVLPAIFYKLAPKDQQDKNVRLARDRIREGSILRRRNRGEIPRALSPHYRRPGPRYGGIPEYRRR